MRRVLFVMVSVFWAVCLFGISSSLADDSEEVDGVARVGMTAPAPTAIADQNYIKEIWVSDSSLSTSKGQRVFSSGTTLYLHVNFYLATAGECTRYYFTVNAAGSVARWNAATSSLGTGDHHFAYVYSSGGGLAAGVYFFTSVITAQGNHMVSPSHCWFIIE